MSTTENRSSRWRLRPRAAIEGGVAVLLLAGISLAAIDDVGTHRALGSAQSSLAATQRDLTAASAAAGSLSGQLGVLGSAQASLRAQDALLASENASLAAQLSVEASAQAAHAGAPIFERSASGGIPEPAAIGVVIAYSGPYVVRYTFSACSTDSPIAFTLLNGATNEFVRLAPNASGKLIGANDVYLAGGNWFLFGGGQLVSTGGYDPRCRWSLQIAPND